MNSLGRIVAIVRADFLLRFRRVSTVVLFLLLSAFAYVWVPAPSSGRTLIQINGHRAIYNSGAIGMGTASLAMIFIGLFGYYVICHQYFDRYHLPVMHTETNRKDSEAAPARLWKEWSNILRLQHDGVPIVGFTWFSLTDQVDWDTALREDHHRINPLGLFDLKRRIRPVGSAYRELIRDWRNRMPMESALSRAGQS